MASHHSTKEYVAHGGLRLPKSQAITTSPDTKQWVSIPSQSVPTFGGYFTIDYKNKGVSVEDVKLEFYVSPITGISGASYVRFSPAIFWIDHVDIVLGSVIIDTIYSLDQFITNQLFSDNDERRRSLNVAMGNYADASQRNTIASQPSYYYVPLWTFFRETDYPIIHTADVQFRIYMKTLASQVETDGTGTPSAVINSCNLLMKQNILSGQQYNEARGLISKAPLQYRFMETRYQKTVIQAGVSSAQFVLSSITGVCDHFHFEVQVPSAQGSQQYAYQQLSQWELLDGSSTNIIGGVPYKDTYNRFITGAKWVDSTYLTESGSYVYFYAFSSTPSYNKKVGTHTGTYTFRGNETLKITFPSSLNSPVEITFYGHICSALSVNFGQPTKVTLYE